ncbi:S-methyl-5-thioribose-1-phosphate isomerase [Paremcibacter congregatus]|uniref:S-methyl-5-thioribose-1-phosphate isomerase n=1 Tax=Paremcibacter congregatus TaxID=2043170 RepID=UPI0030EE07E6
MPAYKSIEWLEDQKALRLLDQTKIPAELKYVTLSRVEDIAAAITDMVVRGAPAIGVTAAYGLAVAAWREESDLLSAAMTRVADADAILRASRPTAVNLFWALDQMHHRVARQQPTSLAAYRAALVDAAHALAREDVEINKAIGHAALDIVPQEATFIHHCNTGGIATVDYGTALGIIRIAHEAGRKVHVYVDETRPRLQGGRLTSWELQQLGISHQIIVDGASGFVMKNKSVDMCVVGCDRVAMNGDVANKIGTYNLALVAQAHGVPFYVAAPISTIDPEMPSGDRIEIEERPASEITEIDGVKVAPEGAEVFNPAFDVTPAHLISGIITEKGIIYPPFEETLKTLFLSNEQDHE